MVRLQSRPESHQSEDRTNLTRLPLFFLLGVASLGVASAQPIGFTGPVEGYIFDAPTASLRAVMGFPGAASFGPVLLGGLEFASAAPRQNYAVAFQSGSCVLVTSLDSGAVSTVAIPAATRRPERIAWSGDGTVAVLYSSAGSWIQMLAGLPGNPAASSYIDLSVLGGSLTAVAVSADGKEIAVGMAAGAGVYLMTPSQAFAPVLRLSNPVALSFSSDNTQLFAIDTEAMQLAVVTLSSFDFQMISLNGLADPFALRQGSDQKLYVASRSDRILREYDLSSLQPMADLSLPFAPTGVELFGANSFLVASRIQAEDPLWLVTNTAQPTIYFVPAIPQVIGLGRIADTNSPAPIKPGREGHSR